jgi:membrane protease YdiL (CAAX protease family)
MRLSYLSAFLLTIFFLLLKIVTEVLLSFLDHKIFPVSTGALFSEFYKLTISFSFIIPFIPVFLWAFFKYSGKNSIHRLIRLPYEYYRMRSFAYIIPALVIGLPVSFQILGDHMVWVSMLVFPCNDTYRTMMTFLEPTGTVYDIAGSYITIGIIGPVSEELFFRGILFTGLLNRYGKSHIIPILIFQGLLFGAAHLNIWQIGYAAAMGITIGWVRYRTGSITAAALIHIASNTLAVILMYHIPSLSASSEDVCDDVVPVVWYLLLLAGFLLAGSLVIIQRKSIEQKDGSAP